MTGGHHWAERYDRELGDIFAVQDEITRSVAGAIEPHLLAAEGVRALSRSADDLGAWELVARAQTHVLAPDARGLRDRSRALSNGPSRLIRTTRRHEACWVSAWCLPRTWDGSIAIKGCPPAAQHALRAIALDDRDPWGHIALGYWAMMERRTEELIAAFRRAVNLNPNSAAAHSHLGHVFAFARAGSRGHRARRRRRSGSARWIRRWRCSWAASRLPTLLPGDIAEAVHYTTEALRLRPVFRVRSACAARAWPMQAASMKRGHILATVRREQTELSVGLDHGERSLSDARADGALSGRYAESRFERGIKAAVGQTRRRRFVRF